jgi:hypothetical protein
MVDQHDFSATVDRSLTNLFCFAAADEESGVGPLATTRDSDRHTDSSRLRQLRKFFEIFSFDGSVETNTNEDGTLAAAGTLKHVR